MQNSRMTVVSARPGSFFTSMLLVWVFSTAIIIWSTEVNAQLRRIAIGTNPSGTNYFLVASGIAKVLQSETQIPSTVRPFSGSSVYIPMLQRGEMPLGINTQLDTYVSYSGLEPYPAPMTNLRLLVSLMPLYDNYLVRADSNIEVMADLEGKRVVTAFRSNVALERWHFALLATGGLRPDDIEIVTVASLPDGIRMLTEGRADATAIGLDTGLVRQADATIPGGVRFLGIGSDSQKLSGTLPGAGVYIASPESVGVSMPTVVGRFDTYLNTGAHILNSDAYLIVKTIYENWETLRSDYNLLRPILADMLVPADSPHPYHPGAIQYWREVGLWTDSHELNQALTLMPDSRL